MRLELHGEMAKDKKAYFLNVFVCLSVSVFVYIYMRKYWYFLRIYKDNWG